jgi:adenylate cyclase
MKFPFSMRSKNHRNFLYHIDLDPGENKVYYLLLAKTMGGLILPVYIWDEEEYYIHDTKMLQGLGSYFGIMFVMLIYNFFIFVSVRET